MNRALAFMVLLVVMMIGVFLFFSSAQAMEVTHSGAKRLIAVERERSKEFLSVTWEEEGIRVKNIGSRDTVIRYIYYYFGERVPQELAELDIPLKVSEEILIKFSDLGFNIEPEDYLSQIPKLETPGMTKYYLCYDGFEPDDQGLGDYETECIRLMSNIFPEHDRLDWGVSGLAWYRSTESHQQIVTQPEYGTRADVWSVCVWFKLEATPNRDFALLEVKPSNNFPWMYFLYDGKNRKIYAKVGNSGRLGENFNSNPSKPISWGHYCIVLDSNEHGFEAKFYFNGTLVDSDQVSGSGGLTQHVELRFPGHPPVGHWIDEIFVTNRTLTPSEISILARGGDPLLWGFMFDFDYLGDLPRVEVVTDLGLKFSATKPNLISKGITPEG